VVVKATKKGVPDTLVMQPFCFIYHRHLREGLSNLGKIMRPFVTLCFIYSVFKYFTSCTENAEDCQNLLGDLSEWIKLFFISIFENYVAPLAKEIWDIPIVGVVVYMVVFVMSIPFTMSFVIWGLILYLADFVVQSTVLLFVWQAVSLIVKDYRVVKSTVTFILQTIKLIWKGGRKVYYKGKNVQNIHQKKE